MTCSPSPSSSPASSPPELAGDFECPEAGGPAWREVQTAHFVVQTNLSSGKAQALAREVERLYEVLLHAMFKAPPAFPGKVRVVALQSDSEFDLFAPKGSFALYQRGGFEGATIVVHGYMDSEARRTIAHELRHHVAARLFLRQPHWFSEGLASYMETLGSSGPGHTPTVGGANQGRFRSVFPWHGGLARVFPEAAKRPFLDRLAGLEKQCGSRSPAQGPAPAAAVATPVAQPAP